MLHKLSYHYRRYRRSILLVSMLAMLFMMNAVAYAQTEIPPIEIPTDDMVVYLNQWIAVFAGIFLFIGMIPVALSLLQYIVGMFQKAFRGGGR